MPIRAFRLPGDIQTLIDVLPLAFHYPENPAWSLDAEEIRGSVEQMQKIQRMWPLFRILLAVSPRLRDQLNGIVWEEDGKPVGIANIGRQGMSDSWQIANVSVLPSFRRRGIARNLVEGTIDFARGHGAQQLILQVIDGNTPAFDLYKSLGFDLYDTQWELTAREPSAPSAVTLPAGYIIQPMKLRDWRQRYELALRITPPATRRFEPVTEARYRTTRVESLIETMFSGGNFTERIGVFDAAHTIVAYVRYSARLRPGGVNSLSITLDPAHSAIAPYLVRSRMAEIIERSPGRAIEFRVDGGNPALLDAAVDAGFVKRMAANCMGICL